MSDLKPCPFCGSFAQTHIGGHDVRCSNPACSCQWIPIKLWNTRADSDEVKRLREVIEAVCNHYSGSLDYRHAYVRMAYEARVVIAPKEG
jgi:hypothetical protein